jgi:hypothetical protein
MILVGPIVSPPHPSGSIGKDKVHFGKKILRDASFPFQSPSEDQLQYDTPQRDWFGFSSRMRIEDALHS